MKIEIFGKSYDVEISEIKEGKIKVKINGEEYFFSEGELEKLTLLEEEKIPKKTEIIRGTLVEKEIRAPITGIISEIFVSEGENIRVGKKVLTLISMKMENEIIAESEGKIKEIRVRKDQFVNTNDILIILE